MVRKAGCGSGLKPTFLALSRGGIGASGAVRRVRVRAAERRGHIADTSLVSINLSLHAHAHVHVHAHAHAHAHVHAHVNMLHGMITQHYLPPCHPQSRGASEPRHFLHG